MTFSNTLQSDAGSDSEPSTDEEHMSRQDVLTVSLAGLKQTMETLGIEIATSPDLGLFRAQVLFGLGLGFPPKSYWTRRSVEWIMTQALGLYVTRLQMSSKKSASDTLELYLQQGGKTAPEDEAPSSEEHHRPNGSRLQQ